MPGLNPEARAPRVLRNVGWNLLGQAGAWAVSFVLTPYLVRRLGNDGYGLYILLHVAAGYALLLNFSAGSAALKFTAEFARSDSRGLRQTVAYAALLHLLGALLGATLLYLAAGACVDRLFQVPPRLRDAGVWMLRAGAAGTVFLALYQCAGAVLQGLERFDAHNLLVLAQSALLPLGAALLVSRGFGLRGVAAWYAALHAALALVAAVSAWRFLAPRWHGPEGAGISLPRFWRYGASLWAGQAGSAVTAQLDKVLLGHHRSLASVTLYAVPANLLARLQLVPAAISSTLLPVLSGLSGRDGREDLPRLYLRSTRALLWAALAAPGLLFALMPQFLTLWLGPEFGRASVWPARLLVISHAAGLLSFVPSAVAVGRGRPLYQTYAGAAQALLSLAGWLWLVPRYGLLGAAWGTLAAQCLTVSFYLAAVHGKIVGLPWRRFAAEEGLLGPAVSATALLAVVMPLHHLAGSWGSLLALCAAGAAAYAGAAWAFMPAEDKELARSLLGPGEPEA